jgi:hypothetical protein
MSEELKPEVKEPEVKPTEPVVEVDVSVDPAVERALEQGWVPKEQWTGDPEEWRPAKEFVARGELYKSIHSTKRELKQTQAALTALQRHHVMVFEKAHQQALADLKKEKRLAIREGDLERLEEVEDELDATQARHAQERAQIVATQQAAQAAGPNPAFSNFVERNQWYVADSTLRDEADAIGYIYMNKTGDADGLFAHVEKEMRRKFPEKFGVKRAAPNAVASVDRTGKKVSKSDEPYIDSDTEKVIKSFTEATGMSRADYIKELKKIGAL